MSDLRPRLDGQWGGASRFNSFGNVLTSLVVRGVRCHDQTEITFRNPITAFTGFNGTGKSTLLQLCAAAYKSPASFTINSFMRKGPLDQDVFHNQASVQFDIQDQNATRPLTLSYNPTSSRWQGYGRRPEREVFYGGVGVFLPRSEQDDFVFRNSSRLTLGGAEDLPNDTRQRIARILSSSYDSIKANTVNHRAQQDMVLSASRGGKTYSEAHMGCGEGRIQSLVNRLEALPPKSLILLEEPEISLHPYAEYELGKYFIDLVSRKYHQIIITTHSSVLLRAFSDASLIYLSRLNEKITPLPGIGSRQAASLLIDGRDRALTILVEDIAAQLVLTELIRLHDTPFLSTIHIAVARDRRDGGRIDASGKDAIRSAMKSLSEAGLKLAAVLDGGEATEPRLFIYGLPGTAPPEAELFGSSQVKQMLVDRYSINLADLEAELAGQDCHSFFKTIGRKASCTEEFLIQEAAREYAKGVDAATILRLIALLKEAANRR